MGSRKSSQLPESDLAAARRSLDGDHKWATVQGYYWIFHAARALLFARGYREKGHRGLQAMLRLYSSEIPQQMFDDFRDAMIMRESADYGLVSSVEGAEDILERAEGFLKKAKALLHERSVPRRRRLRSK